MDCDKFFVICERYSFYIIFEIQKFGVLITDFLTVERSFKMCFFFYFKVHISI